MESEAFGIYIAVLIILGIVFLLIPGIIVGIVVPTSIYRNRHIDFVNAHSEALAKIKEINSRYTFFTIPNFDMSHSYDNNDFYPTVSPRDYLTYELVHLDKKVSKALQDSLENRCKYEAYKSDIKLCHYGVFNADTSEYNVDTLKKYEKKLVGEILLTPTTGVEINVVFRFSLCYL